MSIPRKQIFTVVSIGLLLAIAMLPGAESQYYFKRFEPQDIHYFQGSIWLFLYCDNYHNDFFNSPSLIFGPNCNYFESFPPGEGNDNFVQDFGGEFDWVGELGIYPNETQTLLITGVEGRIYNPDIPTRISLTWTGDPGEPNADIFFQLRFDGDNDGNFEYIINFPENLPEDTEEGPLSTIGQPIDMTDGTIELIISRTDENPTVFKLWCSHHHSYIQVPFDLDTDGDGMGDYSDLDDDNDGHEDIDDLFIRDSNEWEDSDLDGIGNNADEDDNGNGIPDTFEFPLIILIVMIPFIIIWAFLHKRKKKPGDEEAETKK